MHTQSLSARKNYWLIPFLLLLAAGTVGSFFPMSFASADTSNINSGDMAWMLTASGLVLLMTPGLSFFYGGMVQPKNILSTMLQSFIALGVISVLWYVVGFSLAFGDSYRGIIGNPLTFMFFRGVGVSTHPALSPTIPLLLFAAFQLKFAVIAPALITGAFAERVRFSAYLLFICLFSLVIYSPLAHWTWHPDGFLRQMGVLDFAGGTVVHISAGFAALAGAMALGRRKVHIHNEVAPATNIPYVLLGTGMLWFGWFGFNAGSALAANGTAGIALLTTQFASASAMLAWIFFDAIQGRKPSALGACIGAVVGLVAITPAAGFVGFGHSILIGFIASVISNVAVHWKNTKSSIDDTLDVFPCHGVGGIVGMIATGIFANEVGLIHGTTTTFFNHLIALMIVSVFTFGGSLILYKIVNAIIPMRVREEQEEVGLDISQHNESVFEEPGEELVKTPLEVPSMEKVA
jgi:Amt family ammonium transporter